MKATLFAVLIAGLPAAAIADGHAPTLGDAAEGETKFNRQCVACHVVANDAGEVLAGRNAKTGPNLYAVAGRPLGAVPDFRYSSTLVEMGEGGAVWTEEAFAGFVQDPTEWMRANSDDARARSKMSFKVRQEQDAYDIFAYIASLSAE